VQHLDFLDQHQKDVFKTFGEISQKEIVIQASQRQRWFDQGQSLNLMVHPQASLKDVNSVMIMAWKLGVKSLYYQRGTNPAQELSRSLLTECATCEG
jgi:ribonucleoside-diphosphate reductase alpha chain